MTGLEKLIEGNIDEIASGIPWVLIGKDQTTRGYKQWTAVVLYEDESCADDIEFRKARILLNDDSNAILINSYHNAWVGVDEDGGYESIKDIAKRIKAGYDNGWCRATHTDISMLKPKQALAKHLIKLYNYGVF